MSLISDIRPPARRGCDPPTASASPRPALCAGGDKCSAHNNKEKNAAHTRKMQQMRLEENSRSKSEPDVGSSAGVWGVWGRFPVLAGRGGGGAAASPLARSSGLVIHDEGRRSAAAQQRARATRNKPHTPPITTTHQHRRSSRQHKSAITTATNHGITYHNHNENIPCGL